MLAPAYFQQVFKIVFWWGNLRERDHLEDNGTNGTIILKQIFDKWDVEAWNGLMWFRIGTGGGRS
jgi:hypothetical protein